ncbi:DUF4347 domain-containing protein [Szabonella alba]|uniref:DUF4347 domain-containing protein n=1 Tax=Szabonella alba TaxID=2804194 RepID=A0A8K0VGK1_9RHOB|nr:DUF4347 domain-containing protein [Szabonella alba]MBL4919002.1 DUF4347 domain-containing protein [Szabonella alba]
MANPLATGIVFVDAALPNFDEIIAQLGSDLIVHTIPADGDGLSFIADTLANETGVEAVHILSHGAPGMLVLGDLALTEEMIAARPVEMDAIRSALSANADLLIYGCDLAAGETGRSFVDAFAAATGADVAASTDLTGLGGDWDLEHSTGPIEAAPLSFDAFNATLLTTPYTENAAAVQIDPTLALAPTGVGDDYSGGSLLIEGSGAAGETLGFMQSGSPDFTLGAISVVGAGIYRGTGSGAEVIGGVDAVKNGQNGADLLVNFSVGFTNGTIDAGTPGSTDIEGWVVGMTQIVMGSSEIAGWTTPVDTTYPGSNSNGDVSTGVDPSQFSVILSDYDAGYVGDLALRLGTGNNQWIGEGYGVIRGPYVYSEGTVVLQQGDSVSFAWKALSGGDAFDAYGYLLNVQTGETITILDQTGTQANQETAWATVSRSVGAGQEGEYRFVFITGSYDLTGGTLVGASLMVDEVTVTQANPPAPVQEFNVNDLAKLATFSSTADDFDDTAVTITYTATPGTPAGATTSYSGSNTIAITETNDAPEFTAGLSMGSALPGGAIESTVSDFATAAFSDPDSQFAPFDTLGGIAIAGVSNDPEDGTWFYSADGGDSWSTLPAVSAGSALVLDAAAMLRFEPAPGFTSSVSLSVHAVDSTWSAGFSTGINAVMLDTSTWTDSAAFSANAVTAQAVYEQLISPTASFSYADTTAVDDFTAQSGTVSGVTDTLNTGRSYSYALDGGTDAGDGTDTVNSPYGTLTLNRSTGAWSFEPNDASINALGNGTMASVTFGLIVEDGTGGALTQNLTLNLTGADDPILFEAGEGAQFLARGEAVAIASELALSDDGAAMVGKATVTMEQGVRDNAFGNVYESLSLSSEALDAATLAGVAVDIVNGDTGSVVTLTGDAMPAVYETILRGIIYTNSNPNAVVGTRTVAFEVEDTGGNVIETDSVPVQVAWAPWFDMNGPSGTGLSHEVTHVEEAPPVYIATSDAQILDQDGTISSVTVTLTNPLDNTEGAPVEYLSISAPVLTLLASHGILIGESDGVLDGNGNLTGATEITFSAAAGQTATRFQIAMRGVQYTNTADNPTATDRIVTVNGVDSDGNTGLGGQTIIHIEGSNDAPVATPETATGSEDTDYVFATGVFGFSDPVDGGANHLAAVLIDTLPASGTLILDGVELTGPTEVSAADIAEGLLVYRPAADQFGLGVAAFNYRLRDDSGAANDLSEAATLTIDLAPENDAPVLSVIEGGALNPIDEDVSLALNTGSTVAEILSASGLTISDVDLEPGTEAQAIAVTALDSTNGSWQFKIADGQWSAVDIGAVNAGNALLLDAGDALRFLPSLDWNGTVEQAVTFRAWDKTAGNAGDYVDLAANAGGTGSVSLESGTADITVEGVDDAPFISGRASVTLNEDGTATINGFTIGDGDGDALSVRITMPDPAAGTLDLETTTGITGTTSGTVLEFSGSIADLQTALNSLRYTAATDYNGSFDLQLEVSDDEGATWQPYSVSQTGQFFWAGNGHYYEFVSAPGITWQDAMADAEERSLFGLEGYLATVTSAEENAFIAPLLGGQGWIGASDEGDEGAWMWMTGPEAGTYFWQGLSDGGPVNGEYSNWSYAEPNDLNGEDYAHYLIDGTWNDFPLSNGSIQGYVVEYGGMPGDAPVAQAAPLTITVNAVNDAPVLAANDVTLQMSEDDQGNSGHLVSDLLGAAVSDVDSGTHSAQNGTLQGIAVYATEPGNGAIEYSLDGGETWDTVLLTEGEVLLLRSSDLIRHEPDGQNGGTASFGYYAWDQSTGMTGHVVAGIAGDQNAANRGGDSAYSTDAATVSFDVADADDAPTLTASSDAEYYARGPAVAVFGPGDVVLSDVDGGATLTGATVTLDPVTAVDNLFGNWEALSFEGGPVLTTSSGAVLTVAGNGTALTLSGSGTLEDYAEALEALRYANGNPNMTVGARSVILTITDDTGLTSAPVTATVDAEWATVVDLNGAGAGRDHAVSYTEGAAGVAIAAADAELIDQDGVTLTITATLLDAVNGEDETLFIAPSTATQLHNLYGITIDGSGTAAITLTAINGLDPTFFQAALRSIQYANASTNPTDAARHVLVETVDMAGHPGISATTTINVTPVNATPVVGEIENLVAVTELADASAQMVELNGSVTLSDGDLGETVELVATGPASVLWSGGAELPEGVDVAALIDPAALTLGSVVADGTAQTLGWTYAATANLDWLADGETLTLVFNLAGDDGHGVSEGQPLEITFIGTNDAPTDITLSATEIDENRPDGAARIVATIDVLDADISDHAHTIGIAAGGDGFFFELVNGNELKFRDGVTLDAEGKSSYTVNLTATDALGQSVTTQHVITLGDVNEFVLTTPVFDVTPIIPGMRANLIPVDTADGSFVGVRAISTDADATDEVVLYELVADLAGSPYAGGNFQIDATGPGAGRIYLAEGADLVPGTAYDLFVRATSTDGSSQISSIRMQASPGLVTLGDKTINAAEADAAPFVIAGLSAGATVIVTFSDGMDSVSVTVTADGAHSADLTGLADGPVTVSYEATSATGTHSGSIAAGEITLDTDAPAGVLNVTFEGPAFPGGPVIGTVTGVDEGAGWEYSRDGGESWMTGDGNSLILSQDSQGEVLLRQFDQSGNHGAEITRLMSGSMLDDSMTGSSGADSIYGWDGADMIAGGDGADMLVGGAGNDTIAGGAGADMMLGGDGTDTLDYSADTTGVAVRLWNLTAMGGDAEGDVYSGFENVTGGSGNDTLNGDNGANILTGGEGHDFLFAVNGNDLVYGGAGNDTLYGGIGDDLLNGGTGNDRLYGDAGNDTLIGGAGADTMHGGDGIDTLDYSADTTGVAVRLWNLTAMGGDAEGDVYTGIENLIGGSGNDTLNGDNGANVLTGGEGNDFLFAVNGNDLAYGGAGNDTLYGGVGDDTLDGGTGHDRLYGDAGADLLIGGAGNDTVAGGAGADTMHGGDGIDTLDYSADTTGVAVRLWNLTALGGDAAGDVYTGFENLIGGSGNDTLNGDNGANVLTGGNGNDFLFAVGGNDLVYGGAGNDTLYGGAGDDTIEGGSGNDRLYGDAGADSFIFKSGHGQDTILDFSVANDRLQLSAALVEGLTTGLDVLAEHASITSAGVTLDFGGGNSILLHGVNSLTGLEDRIDIFGDTLL